MYREINSTAIVGPLCPFNPFNIYTKSKINVYFRKRLNFGVELRIKQYPQVKKVNAPVQKKG